MKVAGIKLLELTSMRDFMVLSAVRVEREQRRFTRNPVITYLQTRHPAVTTYRIDLDEKIIGFVMLIHAENPVQWIIERLTIDRDYQRQGHGFAVADQLIDMIHDFENSEMVLARYNPENEAARLLLTNSDSCNGKRCSADEILLCLNSSSRRTKTTKMTKTTLTTKTWM